MGKRGLIVKQRFSDGAQFTAWSEAQIEAGVPFLKILPLRCLSGLKGGSDIPQGIVKIKTDEPNGRSHVSWHSEPLLCALRSRAIGRQGAAQ